MTRSSRRPEGFQSVLVPYRIPGYGLWGSQTLLFHIVSFKASPTFRNQNIPSSYGDISLAHSTPPRASVESDEPSTRLSRETCTPGAHAASHLNDLTSSRNLCTT